MKTMTCDRAIKIVMSLDENVVDAEVLQRARQHVVTCPQCASWDTDTDVHKTPTPLTTVSRAIRLSLWLVGLLQLLVALPWIFGATPLWDPSTSAADSHLTRDGVLGILFAFAALVVAWSQRLSHFVLPACAVLLAIQIVALIVDQQTDLVHVRFESVHLLTLAITALVAISVVVSRKQAIHGFRGLPG